MNNVSDTTPQPNFVGYPRNTEFGVPGLYGSAKRLEALRAAQKNGRPFLYVVVTSTVIRTNRLTLHDPVYVAMLTMIAVAAVFVLCRIYVKLADAREFNRGWVVAVGIIAALNPFLWTLIATGLTRYLGYMFALFILVTPMEFIMRSEAKRYGIKYSPKNHSSLIARSTDVGSWKRDRLRYLQS